MKLQQWLDREDRSRAWFARQFKPEAITPQTVDGWCKSPAVRPQRRHEPEIARITGGEVTAADFLTSETITN